MNKKAQFGIIVDYWLGLLALLLLVLGAFFALTAENSLVVLILALVIGLFFGAHFYNCKKQGKSVLFFVIVLLGLFTGYLIGAWEVGVSPIFTTFALIAGIVFAYFIHTKGFVNT